MNVQALENITTDLLQLITSQQAWHYQIIPIKNDGRKLTFGIAKDKLTNDVREELSMVFSKSIDLISLSSEAIKKALAKYYRNPGESKQSQTVSINDIGKDSSLLDNLIIEANELGASDIHFEPFEKISRIRYRIDGVLVEKYELKKEDYPGMINKIKIKANLDIAEKRLPQDGRIFIKEGDSKFDIRVSSLPTLHGEKIVMRILNGSDTTVDIRKLGFRKEQFKQYLEGIRKPNGIVLISGPTGSGKTTTLYGTLKLLNNAERNIVTIEDPIEYTMEGINQVQLKESIGLDFTSTMRTFLRQDPDVIMVGEIRDVATANMAIRASLTGHLVLSTIHTSSAWGIISRLVDMGVPEYLLADTLNTAMAQRLVRLLCGSCKKLAKLDPSSYPRSFVPPLKLKGQYVANGCDKCLYTGYKGRTAVYEVIPIDSILSDKIKNREFKIDDYLTKHNISSLSNNAFKLLSSGLTSLKEVYPILASDR